MDYTKLAELGQNLFKSGAAWRPIEFLAFLLIEVAFKSAYLPFRNRINWCTLEFFMMYQTAYVFAEIRRKERLIELVLCFT